MGLKADSESVAAELNQRGLIRQRIIKLLYIDLRGVASVSDACGCFSYLRYWQAGDLALIGDCDGEARC